MRDELIQAVQTQLKTTNFYAVNSDVYFDFVPEDTATPYVAWYLISLDTRRAFAAAQDFQDTIVQISTYVSTTASDCCAVMSDIDLRMDRKALTFPSGWTPVGCIRTGNTGPTWDGSVWQGTQDYRVVYK